MLNKIISSVKERDFSKNIRANKLRFGQINAIITSIVILAGVQGIHSSNVLAFDIIPLDAVSTITTSSQNFGFGRYSETFQVGLAEKS